MVLEYDEMVVAPLMLELIVQLQQLELQILVLDEVVDEEVMRVLMVQKVL